MVSEPTGATTTSYTWAVTFNGQPYPPGTATNGPSFTFTPAVNGLYGVSLNVVDSNGGTAGTSVFFVVTGAPPAASILGAPATGEEGTPIKLGASVNPGLSGKLFFNWAVYLNGGSTPYVTENNDTTGFLSFTPNQPGSYTVTLSVSDGVHSGNANPVTIPVNPVPPTATITSSPTGAAAGQPVTLTGSATSAGSGDPVTSLTWSVFSSGAGQVIATGTGATFSYKPLAAGVDIVTLTATDQANVKGATSVGIPITGAPVGVVNLTAVPPAGYTSLQSGLTDGVSAAVMNPPAGVTYNFAWTVTGQTSPYSASGSSGPGTSSPYAFNFLPQLPGTYLVSVTATGSDGSTALGSHTFTVAQGPLTAAITGATVLGPGRERDHPDRHRGQRRPRRIADLSMDGLQEQQHDGIRLAVGHEELVHVHARRPRQLHGQAHRPRRAERHRDARDRPGRGRAAHGEDHQLPRLGLGGNGDAVR